MSAIKISKDKNGNCYGPQVITPIGRAMYVNLATPNTYKKYTCNLVLEKTEENKEYLIKEVLSVAKEVLEAMYGVGNVPEELPSSPLMDGDEPNENGVIVESTKGCWILRMSSNEPLIGGACVDNNAKPYDAAKIAPGNFIRAVVTPMAFKMSSVSFGLVWKLAQVQFLKDDGVRLRGNVPTGNLLTPLSMEEVPTTGLGTVSAAEITGQAAAKKSGLTSLA